MRYSAWVNARSTGHTLSALHCLGALSACMVVASCASVSPLSGAKTLKAGTGELAVAAELLLPANDDDSGREAPVGLGPVVSYRHGLSDSIDAAIRLYFIGVSAEVRYALAKGRFSASVGALAGSSSVSVSLGGSESEYSVTTFEVPLYLEYALSSSFSVLAVPRFGVARFDDDGDVTTNALALLAIGFPINIGRIGILPSFSGGLYGDAPIVAAAVGFSF